MVKNERGFTLVEIIVVLVILAVIAAFTMPTMLGFTGHAKESLCDTERVEIVKYFKQNARIHPGLTIQEFIESNYGQMDSLCPAGGDFYAYSYFEDEQTAVGVVYCSEHTTTADGRLYILSRQTMDNFLALMDSAEKREYLGIENNNFSNDTFRAKIFEENGNTWNTLPDDIINKIDNISQYGVDYIQPYITSDKDVVLYANGYGGITDHNWNTTVVFNHEEGIWYEKVDGVFLMSNMGLKDDNDQQVTWSELKSQFTDQSLWKPVD